MSNGDLFPSPTHALPLDQPPTVNPGDTVHITTATGQPNASVTVDANSVSGGK